MERVCRIRIFGIEDWIKSTKNNEYAITYKKYLDQERSVLISFRNKKTYKNFKRDFQIWKGEVLRDVGPSLKIQF